MNDRVAKNYIFNLSYQALLALVPLITQPYASRVLGAKCLGEYSFTQSIVTYFVLLGSLGVNVYGQREIAFVQDDKDSRSKVFFELVFLKLITVGITIVLYFMFVASTNSYKLLLLIQCLDLFATCLDITWFFQGMEEFKKIAIRNSIVKVSGVVFIFLFVKQPDDLPLYVLIYSLSLFLGNITLWMYVPKYINLKLHQNLNVFKHLKYTVWLFIPQVATCVYTVLDKTMIGIIINDTSSIGVYDCVQKIINLFLTVITSMGTVMLPRVSSYHASGNRLALEKSIMNSFEFVFMLSFPMVFGIEIIADRFSGVFWGPDFIGAGVLTRILCLIILLAGLSNVTGTQYMVPTGKEKKFSLSIIIGSIVNFFLNLVLIKRYGAVGACLASVIAELVILMVQIIIIRRELDVVTMLKRCKVYVIASGIMALVISTINCFPNEMVNLVIQILLGIFVYFGSLFLFKEKLTMSILNKFWKGV